MSENQHGMTELMYQYAASGSLTMAEAKKMLHENAYIRAANETLAKYCRVDPADLPALKKRVAALLLESDPSQNRDSVEKKVRTWVNNRVQFISRESALQLAFALHLPVKDTEEMLWRLCGEGFHWRDPQDIIWLYALEHGMDYAEARALDRRLAPAYQPSGEDDPGTMTETIRAQARQIREEEELADFLRENAPHLGALHNTAYMLFTEFMELLKSAPLEDSLPDERRMPAREIVTTYLYNHLIPRASRSKGGKALDKTAADAIRRDIQQNWPDEFALARMANRETDVTRKALILLFLACDGGETSYGDYADDSPESVFEDTYARLSSMLADCGFPPLDPRIPFDWMVLYCMVAEDYTDIDEKIPRFLAEIFPESADAEEA